MKNVFSKRIWNKFIASLLIICSLLLLSPKKVEATSIAGKLTEPIVDFVVFLGDGAIGIAHKLIMGQDKVIIRLDTKRTIVSFVAGVVAGILVIAGSIALGVVTGGISALVQAGAFALISSVASGVLLVSVIAGVGVGVTVYDADLWGDMIVLPLYTLTPEEIFENKIGLFNVNFFDTSMERNEQVDLLGTEEEGNTEETTISNGNGSVNIAEQLQPTISSWYSTIRTIALVAMLSVLVYIGIRILISSSSTNKAKYKQLLVDWCVGICMLFVMHYGMAFLNMFIDKVTDTISAADTLDSNDITQEDFDEAANKGNIRQQYVELIPYENKVKTAIEKQNLSVGEEGEDCDLTLYTDEETGKQYVYWPTNLMGHIRMMASYAKDTDEMYMGYAICFIIMVLFLMYFIWIYLRRVLYMAFLTLIAPFVALTYPLDKVKDGSAQGFNFWFKEYLYNLLLQPLHLLLYTILITSALELATENIIYTIVTLGFLIPAEKLLKKMFGFKGETPSSIPGAAGAALIMGGMRSILGKGPQEKDQKAKEEAAILGSGQPPIDKWSKLGVGAAHSGNSGNMPSVQLNNGNNTNTQQGQRVLPNQQRGENNSSTQNTQPQLDLNKDARNQYLDWNTGDYEGDMNSGNGNYETSEEYGESFNLNDDARNQYLDWNTENYEEDVNNENGNFDTPEEYEEALLGIGGNGGDIRFANQNYTPMSTNTTTPLTTPTPTPTPTSTPTSTDSTNRVLTNRDRFKLASNAYRKSLKTAAKRKLLNSVSSAKPMRFLGGAAAGLAAGTIGLAIGVTSGSPKDAFSYAAAAGLAGNKLGRGVASTIENPMSVAYQDALDASRTPQELGVIRARQRAKKMLNDEQFLQKMNRNLTKEQVEKLTTRRKRDTGTEYERKTSNLEEYIMRGNVTDQDSLIAMAQIQQEKGYDVDKTISIAKISEQVGDYSKKDSQQAKNWDDKLIEDFEKRNFNGQESLKEAKGEMSNYWDKKSQIM